MPIKLQLIFYWIKIWLHFRFCVIFVQTYCGGNWKPLSWPQRYVETFTL